MYLNARCFSSSCSCSLSALGRFPSLCFDFFNFSFIFKLGIKEGSSLGTTSSLESGAGSSCEELDVVCGGGGGGWIPWVIPGIIEALWVVGTTSNDCLIWDINGIIIFCWKTPAATFFWWSRIHVSAALVIPFGLSDACLSFFLCLLEWCSLSERWDLLDLTSEESLLLDWWLMWWDLKSAWWRYRSYGRISLT